MVTHAHTYATWTKGPSTISLTTLQYLVTFYAKVTHIPKKKKTNSSFKADRAEGWLQQNFIWSLNKSGNKASLSLYIICAQNVLLPTRVYRYYMKIKCFCSKTTKKPIQQTICVFDWAFHAIWFSVRSTFFLQKKCRKQFFTLRIV